MKFKHTINVFIYNFRVTYKVLLYRLIILLLSLCMYIAVIIPFINNISDTTQFNALSDSLAAFGAAFAKLSFTDMQTAWSNIRESFGELMRLLGSMAGSVMLTVAILVIVYLVQKFLAGLGNYTAGALINDKMAMRASSPFIGTLIKNLGRASLYNLIYIPLSFVYDAAIFAAVGALVYGLWLLNVPVLLLIFLAAVAIVLLYVLKMTLTCDWLPSLIYGKRNNRSAMAYSFSYRSCEKSFWEVFSNFIVIVLLIFAMNVAAVLLTLGAGLLLTIPASYVLIICFEFVSYCDNNEIKYFTDRHTIVKPDRETVMTREKFFRGEDD